MNRADALAALAGSRVAHLSTTRPEGHPHIVPITFAVIETGIVTMVDYKPKRTSRLQRLENIERHPRASVLVDEYSEDWGALWWVRVDGRAGIHEGDDLWSEARDALCDKYSQYHLRAPDGPAIVVAIDAVSSWSSTP